jgi:hypothetical protein
MNTIENTIFKKYSHKLIFGFDLKLQGFLAKGVAMFTTFINQIMPPRHLPKGWVLGGQDVERRNLKASF